MATRESIYFEKSTTKVTQSGISTVTGEVSDLLCEGEILGLVDNYYTFVGKLGGQGYDSATEHKFVAGDSSNGQLRSVYFNEEPILNQENLYNYQDIKIRIVKGDPTGDIDKRATSTLKPELSFTKSINERLRGPTNALYPTFIPKYYRILNKEIKNINLNIKFSSLYSIKPGEDDPLMAQVEIRVDIRPIFGLKRVDFYENVLGGADIRITEGNLTSAYMKVFPVDLSPLINKIVVDSDFLGWELRVTRRTAEPTDGKTKSETFVDSITEVYSDDLSYPNSAMVYSSFDAEFFSEIPNRYYDVRMRKIKIPEGYDPIKRKQTDDRWNGIFQEYNAWSDNPAWCFYDLINNKRFGLGKYIDANLIDKWTLFSIAQYCDQLVSDGNGGLEPRFSCNLLIQSREEAFKVINDMASIFRSITYYFAGSLFAVQDSPKNPTYQFTNSNVIDGDFSYSNTSRKVRHTVAIVRYNDKDNFYKPAVEYVENLDGIDKFGYKEIETSAFGCTSRGQAVRFGRWILATEHLESESVSFKSGPEGSILRPGDVISVVDSKRKDLLRGGRTLKVESLGGSLLITLDRELEGLKTGIDYTLRLSCPTYNYDSIPDVITSSDSISDIRKPQILDYIFVLADVSSVEVPSGPKTVSKIRISSGLRPGVDIFSNAVWSFIPKEDLHKGEEYRIINISESQDCEFSISAIEYDPLKYKAIELGLSFSGDSTSIPLEEAPAPIKSFTLSWKDSKIEINIIPPENEQNLSSYRVYAKIGGSDPFSDEDIPGSSFFNVEGEVSTYNPSSNGVWWFRIFSVNSRGGYSEGNPVSQSKEVSGLRLLSGVVLSSLKIQGEANPINSLTEHDLAEPTFEWSTSGGDNIPSLFYSVSIIANGKRKTFGNITDKKFQLSALYNLLAAQVVYDASLSSYLRSFSISVKAYVDNNGTTESSGEISLDVSNPQPVGIYSAQFSIDGSLNVYDLSASKAVGYYILYSGSSFTYSSFKNGQNTAVKYKKVLGLDAGNIINALPAGQSEIHVLVVFFDTIDVLKENIFKDKDSYFNNLKGLDPASKAIIDGWELVKDLKATNDNSIKVPLSYSLASKALGRGFNSWIRIKEDGGWVGQGISKVEAVNMSSQYPNYIGYYPYSCNFLSINREVTVNGVSLAHQTQGYYHVVDAFTACGWMHETTLDATRSTFDDALRKTSKTFGYKAREAGYRRYRIYLQDSIKDNNGEVNYAVIGTNANNARYKTIGEINQDYSSGTIEVNSAVLKSAALRLGPANIYENYVLADSPWWKHHSAGFGQGWGGLKKTAGYFDVHLGHLVDYSYLSEAFFAVVDDGSGNKFKTL